ncbi:hypothetical protein BH23GEM9_BH23GEM9_05290 [soil metagenome]
MTDPSAMKQTALRVDRLLRSLVGIVDLRPVWCAGGVLRHVHVLKSHDIRDEQLVRNVVSGLKAGLGLRLASTAVFVHGNAVAFLNSAPPQPATSSTVVLATATPLGTTSAATSSPDPAAPAAAGPASATAGAASCLPSVPATNHSWPGVKQNGAAATANGNGAHRNGNGGSNGNGHGSSHGNGHATARSGSAVGAGSFAGGIERPAAGATGPDIVIHGVQPIPSQTLASAKTPPDAGFTVKSQPADVGAGQGLRSAAQAGSQRVVRERRGGFVAARSSSDVGARSDMPQLELLEIERVGAMLRCRVTLVRGAHRFSAIAEAPHGPTVQAELAARVTLDALRAGAFTSARLEGVAHVSMGQTGYIVVAIRAPTAAVPSAGAAPLGDSAARAATTAVLNIIGAEIAARTVTAGHQSGA